MPQPRDGRVVVDVSMIARWTGPPVGIARVEHELATRAQSLRKDAGLCLWDGSAGQFRALNPRWAPLMLSWHGALDTHQPATGRRGLRALLSFRQAIVMALEKLRLTTEFKPLAHLADRLQRAVLALRRHGFLLEDHRGNRLACVARDWALGEAVSLTPDDVVLLAGTDWYFIDPEAVGALKQRLGFRLSVICYDMIPLLFPEWFPAADAAMVRSYWSKILPIADLVICNSRVIQNDVRAIAEALGVRVPAIAVAPLGFDLPSVDVVPKVLPAGLPVAAAAPCVLRAGVEAGRYALFVSTIEPRKGHALLLDVWERLLARDIPRRHGFRLVFVGRPGWHVDDVLGRMAAASRGGTVLHLQGVGDAELDALYRGAAFCLYPSLYEGFGLPIIEAFARGKAVIASTGGAVPETAGDLAPCLDPTDVGAWEQAMADWIQRPELRAGYEARIRAGFSHPTWAAAAAHILTLAKQGQGSVVAADPWVRAP